MTEDLRAKAGHVQHLFSQKWTGQGLNSGGLTPASASLITRVVCIRVSNCPQLQIVLHCGASEERKRDTTGTWWLDWTFHRDAGELGIPWLGWMWQRSLGTTLTRPLTGSECQRSWFSAERWAHWGLFHNHLLRVDAEKQTNAWGIG